MPSWRAACPGGSPPPPPDYLVGVCFKAQGRLRRRQGWHLLMAFFVVQDLGCGSVPLLWYQWKTFPVTTSPIVGEWLFWYHRSGNQPLVPTTLTRLSSVYLVSFCRRTDSLVKSSRIRAQGLQKLAAVSARILISSISSAMSNLFQSPFHLFLVLCYRSRACASLRKSQAEKKKSGFSGPCLFQGMPSVFLEFM